ncbi:primosomal protein N' [Mycoplasmatota bacterium WC44]
MIAKVIIDVNNRQLNRPFDYIIPKHLEEVIEKGVRVLVPFNVRKIMGFVIDIVDGAEDNLKEILYCLDVVPSLSEELLLLGNKLAIDTSSTFIQTYQTMLPSAMKTIYRKYVKPLDILPLTLQSLFKTDRVYLDTVSSEELKEIKKAIKNNLLDLVYDVKEKSSIKYETYLEINEYVDEGYFKSAKKQLEVYELVLDYGKIKKKTLLEFINSPSAVKALIDKGIISETKEEVYREEIAEYIDKDVTLNDEQVNAFNAIKGEDVFLLHGVTGSGKTEVYLEVIERVINEDKEAIFLVPEISLTYQMISRFKARFKDNVAILHSGLSIGEKYDEWRKIIRKEVKCVIGARSAIFAPFNNIGVIIIDEEHETTYKQEDSPRYHAREVAKLRGKYHKCPVVLGSATPSLESYARSKKGVYKLLTLTKRAMNAKLPSVNVVDMTKENGNFSSKLINEIKQCLDKKEQIMLLLNRRGYSNFVICKDCGDVIKCPDCDVSLTYHKYGNKLVCHYCGNGTYKPKKCPTCESGNINFIGIGTESVEEELNKLFCGVRVLRMDQDTTSKKNSHKKILSAFENKEADILLGTQMIAKGLDFENVTLVGVLACDLTLNISDFRASERTFQLLTQVAGRAGRREKLGKVILQTYNPEHYAIDLVKYNDYEGFYENEMISRKIGGYVPYYFIETIMVSSINERLALLEANKIFSILKKELSSRARLLGPLVPYVSKIKNRYRAQIIIKYKREDNLNKVLEEINKYQNKDVLISVDRYPNFIG